MDMNAVTVAKIINSACDKKNIRDISITKLHKLLYIVYGIYLYVYKKRLFNELPACFPYGPIFKELQMAYKKNDFKINDKFSDDENKIDDDLKDVIDKVLEKFGKYSAQQLSNWSHREDSAWSKVDKISYYWGAEIDEDLIRGEFSKIVTIQNSQV